MKRGLVLFVSAVFLVGACATATDDSGRRAESRYGKKVTILYTHNVGGNLEPCG